MNVSEKRTHITATLAPNERARVGTIIRAYAPCGLYWREDLLLPTAIYVNQGDLIFTACHFDEDQHKGDFYSEFDEPTIEEIRLVAALILSVGLDGGMVNPYPLGISLRINKGRNLCELDVPSQLAEHLRTINAVSASHPGLDGPLPPAFGGPNYQYRDQSASVALQQRLYGAIDLADYLLMRGLATLLKSTMLATHRLFMEEALYSLYVSLDASFRLVSRKLRVSGIASPNTYDAQAFIEKAFGEESSEMRYFEEFYDDRIKVTHPESRFGVFPYAPVGADDFYFLFKGLREVYRLLILGEVVDPDNFPNANPAAQIDG